VLIFAPMTPNTHEPITVVSLEPRGKRRLVRAPGHPGKLVFEDFRGTLEDDTHGIRVYVDLAITAGAEPEIVGFAVECKPGKGLYAREFKTLTVDTYVKALVGYMLFDTAAEGSIHHSVVDPHPDRVGGVKWSKVSEDELAAVARWWHEAQDRHLPAGPYVAEKVNVSHTNARQLILAARRAGLIPPSPIKRKGEE
jgi:hypothetical protein